MLNGPDLRRDLPLPTLRSSALRVCSNLLSLTNPHAKYWRARAAAGQLATPLTNDPQLVITQLGIVTWPGTAEWKSVCRDQILLTASN